MIYRLIDYNEAINFLLNKHYSGRKPQIKYAFGAFNNGILEAVCTYVVPASRSLCIGVMGKEFYASVIELNRLCRTDEYPEQISRFVSWTLQQLKKYNLLIVSYADTAMNHTGAIYQACNFVYTGATKKRTDKYTEGNKHSRHYDNNNNHLRKVRSSKHRYIYFACNKKTKKKFMENLKYKIQSYPKGEKIDYELGYVFSPTIIRR